MLFSPLNKKLKGNFNRFTFHKEQRCEKIKRCLKPKSSAGRGVTSYQIRVSLKSRGVRLIQYYSLHQNVFSPELVPHSGRLQHKENKVEEQCHLQVPPETTTTIIQDDSAEPKFYPGPIFERRKYIELIKLISTATQSHPRSQDP